jgi:hypothetical protein
VGVDLKLVYCRGFFKITGILLSKYTNRKQFTVGDSSKLLEQEKQNKMSQTTVLISNLC